MNRPYETALADIPPNTPYVTRRMVNFVVSVNRGPIDPELERKIRVHLARERQGKLLPKANTVAMPIDSGEYLYYHKSDGRFYQLDWHTKVHKDIILDSEQMKLARKAFQDRWPDQRWVEDFYDPENNKFVSLS